MSVKMTISLNEDNDNSWMGDENEPLLATIDCSCGEDDDAFTRGQGCIFNASNGIQISSDSTPEWNSGDDILHIWGDDGDEDDATLEITPADLPRVLTAIREWNLAAAKAKSAGAADARLTAFTSELRALADRYAKG